MSIGTGVVGGWWGYEATIIRNPNTTNGEKLIGTLMGASTGFLMPSMAYGQAIGGYGYMSGIRRGLPEEYVASAMGRGEVYGEIIGGALQAGVMGWLGSGRGPMVAVGVGGGTGSARAIGATTGTLGDGAVAGSLAMAMDIGTAHAG